MKKSLLITAMFFGAKLAFAQEPTDRGTINTDRPDQTESSTNVPLGCFQVELGSVWEVSADRQARNEDFTVATGLFKYGITDRFELRLEQGYGHVTTISNENDTTVRGFSPTAIGAKIAITEEKGWLPEIALIGDVTLRNGSSTMKPNYVAPAFRFCLGKTLSDKFEVGVNLGGEWYGEDAVATGIYTLALGYNISKRLGCYGEIFGFLPENGASYHLMDGGLTYLIGNDFQLDCSAG